MGFLNSATYDDLGFYAAPLVFVDDATEDGPCLLDPLPGEVGDGVVGPGRVQLAAAMGPARLTEIESEIQMEYGPSNGISARCTPRSASVPAESCGRPWPASGRQAYRPSGRQPRLRSARWRAHIGQRPGAQLQVTLRWQGALSANKRVATVRSVKHLNSSERTVADSDTATITRAGLGHRRVESVGPRADLQLQAGALHAGDGHSAGAGDRDAAFGYRLGGGGGTHTDACEPTGTWTVRARLVPERVQAGAHPAQRRGLVAGRVR